MIFVFSHDIGLETLLILVKKARLRIRKYESHRAGGETGDADQMIPQMFVLRSDLVAALNGAKRSENPEERPNAKVTEEVLLLLRALAPGLSTRRVSTEDLVVRRNRFAYDDATVASTPMLHTKRTAEEPTAVVKSGRTARSNRSKVSRTRSK